MRRAAATIVERHPRIDLLVNNAGVMCSRRADSPDGYELMFAVNHLGPFSLTLELLPALQAHDRARVVNVASNAHYRGHIDFDDLMWRRRRFRWMRAYADSKLANVLFTLALARRVKDTPVTVNCLHPGVIGTNIIPRDNPAIRLVAPLIRRMMTDVETGAAATVRVATDPDLARTTGRYFNEHARPAEPSAEARDRDVQERLWTVSAELAGRQRDAA